MSKDPSDTVLIDDAISEEEELEIIRDEAHRSLDHQIQTINDIDDKAARILRLNLLLIGIIFTGFSIVVSGVDSGEVIQDEFINDLLNLYLISGVSCIILSTCFAIITYTSSSMKSGMSGRDIQSALTNKYSSKKNIQGILYSYSNWMQYNYKINAKNAPLGTVTLLLLLYGIILISVGAIHATVFTFQVPHLIGMLILFAIAAYFTGIKGQIRRYNRARKFDSTQD